MGERVNRLYELRREKRLSQTAVGLKVNLSQSNVSLYERGKTIPADILLRFAEFYGVTTDYILKKTDDRTGVRGIGLSEEERRLVSFYRHLEGNYKTIFDGIVVAFNPSADGKI